ncbi:MULTISPECIES: 2-oxoacid:acceptor oxidoreductase family protein [unclassified Thermoanaerobacterium]|uniref:2-oxoacid:acceptor oxidoreductase family protein n=1 Tax=unclassified Thermoanaerobacterium TaxID=2622527 RepID=UPI000A15AD07|nr:MULTISPECIES: 2-oxoacid:acceptor oxidoreductase family protein [unclassified Thermoanaerobacterium]MDE4543445.1 2-oxoacid:acceptor oxidoreductase family protein [Thermoanaerobacterium sp. R66]ORX22444.1 2-oxoacid:ferredoxin oxidoreductase subunit gamma [Thermoanaerobacterium sp. PSU-2]HHV74663.1 2-oxoacid:ferredoxin oxidoreductase subunit gamma [Thermoanaerobacterium sp.]
MNEKIIFAGFGGQGIMSMGLIMSYAGMMDGKNVSWLPSYGPEMRGGTANCHVTISDEPVGSPIINEATVVVAMNRPSLEKYEQDIVKGGLLLINSSLITIEHKRRDIEVYRIPTNDIANQLGNLKVANSIMIGALIGLKNMISEAAIKTAFGKVFEGKENLIPLNIKAYERGKEFIASQLVVR